jgi:hypothetical protein
MGKKAGGRPPLEYGWRAVLDLQILREMGKGRHNFLAPFALCLLCLYTPARGASLYECMVRFRQVVGIDPVPNWQSYEGVTAAVEAGPNGASHLVLPGGKRLAVQESYAGGLVNPAYHVVKVPFRDFRFDQDKQHLRFASVIEMLKNPEKTRHLVRFGVYEEHNRGVLFDDGIYRIPDGHHRTLMLALHGAFLKHGNKEKLSPDDPKFYTALSAWSKDAVLDPLDKFFVPNGPGTFSSKERKTNLAQLHQNIFSLLGEVEIPVIVYPKKDGRVEIGTKNRTPNTTMDRLLLDEGSQAGIRIQPLGAEHSQPFDAWMSEHRERFPELWGN